jgi:hypothetical protein
MIKKTLTEQAEELREAIPAGASEIIAANAAVSPRWVRDFKNGRFPNPGVQTLDALAEGLKAYRKEKK